MPWRNGSERLPDLQRDFHRFHVESALLLFTSEDFFFFPLKKEHFTDVSK